MSRYYSASGLSGRSWPCAGLHRVRWNAPIALDCAECAGMRRLRWNAPESTDCAELRCLRRIALEFCLYSLAHSQYYPVAVAAWLRPRCCSLQFPGSACRARFLWLTAGSSSRSPAISLQLSVRKINNSGQKLNVLLLPPIQLRFLGEKPRISPQLTCSCVRTRKSARTSELFWVCYIYISVICAYRFDRSNSVLLFVLTAGLNSWRTTG